MKYKPYPKYKDSGVEWLGEIPEGWECKRLKWSTTVVKNGVWGDEPQGNDYDIVCIRVADFNRSNQSVDESNLTFRNIKPSDLKERLLVVGDLLIEKSGGGENWPVGFVVRFDRLFPAVTSNFMARISLADSAESNYFKFFHLSLYSGRVTTRSINQTSGIQNLDVTSYFNNLAVFPPLPTQQTIATFLDTETARIDGLIKDYEELIGLLKEKRHALISHAVTRGLSELVSADDPEFGGWAKPVKLKDSGVEWIGEIPEGWEVRRLKYCIHTKLSYGANESGDFYIEGHPRYIRITDISDEFTLFDTDTKTLDPILAKDYLLENGDILLARSGATVGKSFQYRDVCGPCCFAGYLILCRPENSIVDSGFLLHILQSDYYWKYISGMNIQATIQNVSAEKYGNLPLPIPISSEQKAIVIYLNRENTTISTLISESESAIELLKERRSALITNAVTGKINVENIA